MSERSAQPAVPHTASTARPDLGEGKPLLLLVEDEPLVRQMTAKMIRRLGFRVLLAADGREGLAIIEARLPELAGMVLDIVMPVMNGQELLQALRCRGIDLPVLVCSGYALDLSTDEQAARLVRAVLRKPYTFEQLREHLERLCRPLEEPSVPPAP